MALDDDGLKPLKGVVLCCTALPVDVRTAVAQALEPMGAVHKPDLTSDVTHLVVGSVTTPKYRWVARERADVAVLTPAWADAVHKAWLAGGDIDVAALEAAHRLPAFAGLQICVTGFDDAAVRTDIATKTEQNGATYHPDLTKAVTHLIAAAPRGAKYNAARTWGLKVVSPRWFTDSLWRGMALDEQYYDPNMPEEEQGIGAFKTEVKARKALGKRTREMRDQDAVDEAGQRKLRRTLSSRLDSESQEMWQDLSVREAASEKPEANRWGNDDDSQTTSLVPTKMQDGPTRKNISGQELNGETRSKGLFSGRSILVHGFEASRVAKMRQYLDPNGAAVVQSAQHLELSRTDALFKEGYLLVPHAISGSPPVLPKVPVGTLLVTEWWVERCLESKQIIDPQSDPLSRPLWDVKIAGLADMSISTTGFSGVDVRQISETVTLMGGRYQGTVSLRSSVLIASSVAGIKKEKAFYSRKHGIPVVRREWLLACLEKRSVVPFSDFLLALPELTSEDFGVASRPGSPAATKDDSQGKVDNPSKRKQTDHPKRLSGLRKKQHAVLSLPLQVATSEPAVGKPIRPPFSHDDDAEVDRDAFTIPNNDDNDERAPSRGEHQARRSRPLQEVSPNLSPHKSGAAESQAISGNDTSSCAPTISQTARASSRTARTSSPTKPHSGATPPPQSPTLQQSHSTGPNPSPQPLVRNHQELTADLASLLQRKSASGSAAPRLDPSEHALRRKKRPLGRNLSGNASSRPGSVSSDPLGRLSGEASDAACTAEPAPPSTQLGYAAPDADAHRLQMGRKLGVRLDEEDGRAGAGFSSMGIVKDSDISLAAAAAAGVGDRVRGRQRGR